MTRFGALVERVDKRVPGSGLPLLSVSQTRGVIRRSELTDTPARAESLDHYKTCRSGDIVFNKMSVRAGAMGVAHEAGLVTYHYEVMRPRPGTDARYVVYLMKSEAFTAEMVRRERGIAAGDDSGSVRTTEVPFRVLRTIDTFVPSHAQQRAIADYLDRETAQIDAFIAKNEELVALLNERQHAEFLWVLLESSSDRKVKLGRVLQKLDRPAPPNSPVVTAFRDGIVTRRENRRLEGFTETTTDQRSGYQGIKQGDVVFHGLDGFAGAVGVSESHGQCSPVYHVCRSTSLADPAYIALLLRALGKSGFLEASAWSVRQRSVDFRNWSTFARLQVDLPAVAQQREAVQRLGHVAEQIRSAKATALGAIDLARERRAALISAAVTGKIDVGVAA